MFFRFSFFFSLWAFQLHWGIITSSSTSHLQDQMDLHTATETWMSCCRMNGTQMHLFFSVFPHFQLISYLIKSSAADAGLMRVSFWLRFPARVCSRERWEDCMSKNSSSLIIDKAVWNNGQISATKCKHRCFNELMLLLLSTVAKVFNSSFYSKERGGSAFRNMRMVV